MQWYKRDVDAAINGMSVLTLEERGAYNGVLDMLYSRDGDLDDDDELISRTLRINRRTWRKVKRGLIAHGKIWVSGSKIGAKRVEKTLKESRKYSETQSKIARIRWEREENDNENNEAPMPSGNALTTTTTSTKEERKKEEDASPTGEIVFEDGVVRLTRKDLTKWEQAYPHLSVLALVSAHAAWAAGQPNWFMAMRGLLAKKEQQARERTEAIRQSVNPDTRLRTVPR